MFCKISPTITILRPCYLHEQTKHSTEYKSFSLATLFVPITISKMSDSTLHIKAAFNILYPSRMGHQVCGLSGGGLRAN